jgi:hypothetical protein
MLCSLITDFQVISDIFILTEDFWEGCELRNPHVHFHIALLWSFLLAHCQAAMVTSKQDLCSLNGHWHSFFATLHNRVLVSIHSGMST